MAATHNSINSFCQSVHSLQILKLAHITVVYTKGEPQKVFQFKRFIFKNTTKTLHKTSTTYQYQYNEDTHYIHAQMPLSRHSSRNVLDIDARISCRRE
jgi:hypothetical protein